VAWFGDPWGSFYRVWGGHWRGDWRERKGHHQWRPVVSAFKTVVSVARTTSGRGCDGADALGQLAHVDEGGAVAAASREGGSSLAFGRRKEKMEQASAGLKGRRESPEPLGLEGEVGQTAPKMGRMKLGW
jgi:hypothetical protein